VIPVFAWLWIIVTWMAHCVDGLREVKVFMQVLS
jgi:hypothetical protein